MSIKLSPAAESAEYSASRYREILNKFGFVLSFTKGTSMRPLIWTGHHYVGIVTVPDEPAIGDILLFEQMRNSAVACILHRLIDVKPDPHDPNRKIYVTRGDNCLVCEYITRDDIIGKVTDIYRRGPKRPYFALNAEHISINDSGYQRYSLWWGRLWPVRQLYYRLRQNRFARSCYHVLRKPWCKSPKQPR